MVYGRRLDGESLDFMHSGMLWRDGLVLQDRHTGSLWSQTSGEAIEGPLRGKRLERMPAEVTLWNDWSARHPDTLVLPSDKARRKLLLRLYPRSDAMLGMLGTKNPDPRLTGKELIAGFESGDDRVAVVLKRRAGPQEARIVVDGRPIVLRHAGGDGPTRAWLSTGDPEWERLDPLPARVMYWFIWSALYPESRIVRAEEVAPR